MILVTGATGKQGGAAARHLRARGFAVRALTRNPDKARHLLGEGIAVVRGDYDDAASLGRALADVYGVFSVQTPMEAGIEGEVRQGKAIADAASRQGIAHFVYTSAIGADQTSGVSFLESKKRVEEHLRSLGMMHTILRPVFFMENWLTMGESIRGGAITLPFSPGMQLQQIAVDDIGMVAAHAFEHPAVFRNRAVDIAGDVNTVEQVASTLSRALNREVKYRQVPWEDFERAAGPDLTSLYRFLEDTWRSGRARVDLAALRREFPEFTPIERWARTQNWEQFPLGATQRTVTT
jgi:uncharacterized protein YbjT (DUF2867 family)